MGVLTAGTPNTIEARFDGSGNLRFKGKGLSKVKLKLKWDDNPGTAGDAIGSFTIAGQKWKSPGEDGSAQYTIGPFDRNTGDINVSYGSLNPPIKIKDTRICFRDNDGSDCNAVFTIEGTPDVAYAAMTNSLYVNGADSVNVTVGTNINVVGVAQNATSGSLTGGPSTVTGFSPTFTVDTSTLSPAISGTTYTYTYSTYQFLADETLTQSVSATVYPAPVVDSVSVSPSAAQSGETMTLSWTTSGVANGSVSRSVSGGGSGLSSGGSMNADGSISFTAGVGGVYTVTVTATNGMGTSTTSSPVTFTVYDETPNSFGWDDKLDSAPPNSNQESNTITINGFGPTSYISSKLPIKSNYPVQVMVNGDGVWRNVESI